MIKYNRVNCCNDKLLVNVVQYVIFLGVCGAMFRGKR